MSYFYPQPNSFQNLESCENQSGSSQDFNYQSNDKYNSNSNTFSTVNLSQKEIEDNFYVMNIHGNNDYSNSKDVEEPKIEIKTEIGAHKIFGALPPINHIKYNMNIIYYSESYNHLEEFNNICSYFKTYIAGTFYGVETFDLFSYVCNQIQKNSIYCILIISGSLAKKVFDYCIKNNINNIYAYYIYCFNLEKYLHLKQTYQKLKGIFNSFDDLTSSLFSNPAIPLASIKSSNLIFLSDYNRIYIKFHFEIIRKYSLYKLFKSNNSDKSKFMELIKNKNSYYKDLASELIYNDDEAMVKYFKSVTKEPESELRKVFNYIHNIDNYIANYKIESFYYRYLNKFLREGDFKSFRLLSNHVSKIIYHLYEYKKTHFQLSISTLYRKVYISKDEFNLYSNSIGKVICYPSFISTSLNINGFIPQTKDKNKILVTLIIKQNNSPSIINIKNLSEHKDEEEYLCLPFSFFKIIKTENNMGNNFVYLIALNSEKPIEDMYLDFMENATDNLDPEGLEMIKLDNNGTRLIINPHLDSLILRHF